MLELHKIVKDYPAGDGLVNALKGIDLRFRKSEFVSILGPSGCGKTTMLNIIGGLDQYTSGDLIINGKSTKDFKDRDWDTYRNHSIGFVFQSYNLIPHQTVLQNVEIALTVSGVGKAERKKRAAKALQQVGLGDQLNKRPNQISGGQMQRVAIARALVNDPDIILADEPTGALDTETSSQVMDIMKEISKDRLIIMVTHNPDLARQYSSRIIQMLDGNIIKDSAPLSKEEKEQEKGKEKLEGKKHAKEKKPSMSFATAFMLSLKNLFTKKGRTTLTAFAGSIGIMGIALILAVSQGMTQYINAVQEDALTSYPLTIEENAVDMTSLMKTFMNIGRGEVDHDKDAVYKKTAIYDMMTAMNNLEKEENDLKSFKAFLEKEIKKENEEGLGQAITGLQYAYNLGLFIYTKNVDGNIIKSDTRELLEGLMTEHMGFNFDNINSSGGGIYSMQGGDHMTMGMVPMTLWQEILSGKNGELINDVIKKQYDLVYGVWPSAYNEVVLVLDKNNEIDDITLYALGLEPKESVDAIMKAAVDGTELKKSDSSWTYEEICKSEYRLILNSEAYAYDETRGLYNDLRKTDAGLKYLYDDGIKLKVAGIIRPNENAQSTIISGTIGYTKGLTEYVVDQVKDSAIIKAQQDKQSLDILTGLPFKSNTSDLSQDDKKAEVLDYLTSLGNIGKAEAYIKIKSIPPLDMVEGFIQKEMAGYTRVDMEVMMLEALIENMGADKDTVESYIKGMTDEEIRDLFAMSMEEEFRLNYGKEVEEEMASLEPADLAAMLEEEMKTYTDEDFELYYEELMEFSSNSYEENLAQMGYVDLESPATINIFVSSFKNKDVIEDVIEEYNKGVADLSKIKYTDYLGIMMSSITSIINAITYVLLAFVAISLVVSSIMIGVITLISVQERTKEIGILRAIGASKSDVSSMFNAETMIIGFASGLIGIGVTYLLCIPINIILHRVTGIVNLNAYLPIKPAIILILISIALSLIAGLIPSRSAAKKDPVVALRTE